jgi:hyperosmotically inducible protein
MRYLLTGTLATVLLCSGVGSRSVATAATQNLQTDKEESSLEQTVTPDQRRATLLSEEIRHQLLTLPYYGVFDWLQGEVDPDGKVLLDGQVIRPTTKSDAEGRVKSLEGVTKVVNNIDVLPLSTMDDEIRRATYRAIYKFESPLFQYAIRAVPPIHIIVKNGHVTLKGVVLNEMDRQLAETAARSVPNTFDVKNELNVEKKVTN